MTRLTTGEAICGYAPEAKTGAMDAGTQQPRQASLKALHISILASTRWMDLNTNVINRGGDILA